VLATDIKQTCDVKILKGSQAIVALVEGIATQDRQRQEGLCRAAVIDISRQKHADGSAAGNRAVQEIRTPETAVSPAVVVFNPEEALTQCCNNPDMLREMIQCFVDEVARLFPQMRAALEKGDLVEVGRLGHRMKGTVVYLGAQPARQAALRVERFATSNGGTPSEAEEAISALEHECKGLKAALVEYSLPADPTQGTVQ
jgi:HPt (histidine-containing phosphotransfer) domain-containing protein